MTRTAVAASLALCAGGVLATPGQARTHAPAVSAKTGKVKLTSKTVVISPATVRKYLVGVSRDRRTFKFKRAAGSLRRLRRGKVMLLKGKDVAKVTKIRRARGRLLVTTQPVKLTDVIRSGHIHYRGNPNFRRAFLTRTVPFPKNGRAARRFDPPTYPYLGSPSLMPTARAADVNGYSVSGTYKGFGFSLTFAPGSKNHLDVSGTLSYGQTGVSALSAEVKLQGYVELGKENVNLTVDGGRVTNSLLSIQNLKGKAHITYTLQSGTGTGGIGNPPVLRVPFSLDYSIPGPGGVPLYFKVSMAMLIKLGITSHNAVIRGGADVTSGSTDAISANTKQVSGSESGDQTNVAILSHQNGDVGPSASALPSGTVVALQFPKVGVGLGVSAANVIGYLSRETSIAQTTSPAFGGIGGHYCSHYDLYFTVSGGFETQFGPFFSLGTPSKTLSETEKHYTERGCPRS